MNEPVVRTGRGINAEALFADGNFSITADPDFALLAEHIRPSGTFGCRSQNEAFVGVSLVPGRLWTAGVVPSPTQEPTNVDMTTWVDGTFPLTPALSLGEREPRWPTR